MGLFVVLDYYNQHLNHDRNKQMDKRQYYISEIIKERKYYTLINVGSSCCC